jgi:peptidoglycan hydrolase-like protein with peptidoglycan-binding domain
VQQFQAEHQLAANGVIDTATWQALLRYPPASVTWVSHHGKTTAVASRATLVLTPPASGRDPAKRYEIPQGLGRR